MGLSRTGALRGYQADILDWARRKMKRIAPQDVGARRIGHFGFFRAAYEPSLWRAHLLPELS